MVSFAIAFPGELNPSNQGSDRTDPEFPFIGSRSTGLPVLICNTMLTRRPLNRFHVPVFFCRIAIHCLLKSLTLQFRVILGVEIKI